MPPFGEKLRPYSHGNAISGTDEDCRHGNGMIVYQFCFVFRRNAIVPLTRFPFACLDGNGRERLHIVPLFVSLLVVPFLGTEWLYLKRSRLNATHQRPTLGNNAERSGTIAFPCEQGLFCFNLWVVSECCQ